MSKTGILLINLGTPDAPTTSAIRRYLKEFLSDKAVIDLPWPMRMILLYGIILPLRPRRVQHAYQQIWTEKGSPLLIYSQQFKAALQQELGDNFHIELAMRYGKPSLSNAARQLYEKGCRNVLLFPLFPQYSTAASGSALLAARRALKLYGNHFEIKEYPSFYKSRYYHQAWIDIISPEFCAFKPDFVLFSYHGLPERQLKNCVSSCNRRDLCPAEAEKNCYRAQCFVTTHLLKEQLQFSDQYIMTAFQSRLGRNPWIRPYVDSALLEDLIRRGVKRLWVFCPSFVVDCLETLEEIGIRLRHQWLNLGGEAFQLAPSLNAHPRWVSAFAEMIRDI